MDWWKMFGSTFILIFLAELGDKTQLAAMARAADGPGGASARMTVFLAASSALVLSTLIAVFFGGVLKSLVPDERYIKSAAGCLFIVFGVIILFGVVQSYRKEGAVVGASDAASVPADIGYLGGLALRAALDFEEAIGAHYRRLAKKTGDATLAGLLTRLANAEEGHLANLSGLSGTDRMDAFSETAVDNLDLGAVNKIPGDGDREQLTASAFRDLAGHERATADFYETLARETSNPSLKPLFRKMAREERDHAEQIEKAFFEKA